MSTVAKDKLPKCKYSGNDVIYDHKYDIFYTIVTNSYINATIWEARALAIAN